MTEKNEADKDGASAGVVLERLVRCGCPPENHLPHMLMVGWKCRKCGRIEPRRRGHSGDFKSIITKHIMELKDELSEITFCDIKKYRLTTWSPPNMTPVAHEGFMVRQENITITNCRCL